MGPGKLNLSARQNIDNKRLIIPGASVKLLGAVKIPNVEVMHRVKNRIWLLRCSSRVGDP